ncbi:desulfoferrodoxin [Candidatus Berkelbacteria bacterium RIFCSPHIGHO2_12_FULL_36_9]|uniref:Desulfoferrodoxin n=1 Tax=Candidatus Berkelbacteria bacterium RIFCSPHIGHO2_12_FULL_36_9 TaxID=1797469 RepID=A0A1F5EGX9_9BACT|nr:MAG: desulfoferrodoxin [Candidatus Berkelbacteria bacterium RIFCSPHIGHO2_12_FULL_36_9]
MIKVKRLHEVYKCATCGNIVEVVTVGGGELVCCGQPMERQDANTVDAAQEKHVPIITKSSNGYLVKVGSVPHPMIDEHYIEWIELIADNVSYKIFLKPGDKPQAEFCLKAKKIIARAYCNLHGLWMNK